MKLRTMFTIGSMAFAAWRGYRNVKKDVRRTARMVAARVAART